MDLNDYSTFTSIDRLNYLGEIENLPTQLEQAFQQGMGKELPDWHTIDKVLIAGMGGSAIGADLLAAYAFNLCPLPIAVLRNYTLPAWASGPDTLVVASSHSGNTEETLTAFEQALQNRCSVVALCTGGELAEKARQAGIALWTFEHHGQPRAAVGYSFGLLAAILTQLRVLPDPAQDLSRAITAMRKQQGDLRAEVPVVQNLAKRLAGQLLGRWVMVFGAGVLEPVARRWKTQVNELAKAWAQFEVLPEADHNALAGLVQPEKGLSSAVALFLRGTSNHPRTLIRAELTRQAYLLEGVNSDFVEALGESPLAQQWTSLQLGDYVAYYLAMLYEIDPTPIPALEGFKKQLKEY
jgi:glucose/mannose-6-phosphate isomerase